MKYIVLGALLSVCASAAAAETTRFFGCEVKRVIGSNAYYRTDSNCSFGAGAKDTVIPVSAPASPPAAGPSDDEVPVTDVDIPDESQDLGEADAPEEINPPITDEEADEGVGDENDPPAIDDERDTGGEDPAVDELPGPVAETPAEVDDGNNGHGNDADGFDESNPGQGNGHAEHDDNGHGNDADGFDESNPGNGGGNGHPNNAPGNH